MPTNGMTIDSLNTISSLTAQDEVPVWDKEASGEPTRKITAQNMANSVKSLASLPNTTEMNTAIEQSTADVIRTGDVVNSLTSTATDKPLAAAQGKALNDKIDNLISTIHVSGTTGGTGEFVTTYRWGNGIISIDMGVGTGRYALARKASNGAIVILVMDYTLTPLANTQFEADIYMAD